MNSEHTAPVAGTTEAAGSTNPVASRPPELRFVLPDQHNSLRTVFGGAGVTYVAVILLAILIAWVRPDRQIQARIPDLLSTDIVWLEQPGPGGGGGGGGNESPEPPVVEEVPAVEVPKPEPLPVPDPTPEPEPEVEPPPLPELAAITTTTAPAVMAAPVAESTSASLGLGRGGGAGEGTGGGIGDGDGVGVGDGLEKGSGGGIWRVGNGVESPTLLPPAPKPFYTSEAMLQRVQGLVELDCVVLASGDVGTCDIVKSLDSNRFGLDDEALKAAKRFRFRPGTRFGEPVAVLVRIELEFNMR